MVTGHPAAVTESDDLFHARERLAPAQQRAHASDALALQLQGLCDRSPFYRERWDADTVRRIRSASGQDVADLVGALPFTTKDELRRAEEAQPPFGTHLACDPSAVERVHRTSGTTGRPLVIAGSAADNAATASAGAQAFWCAGLRPRDVAVHCLNYCMWMGGLTDHLCLERTGASVVPFGVGDTGTLVGLMDWLPFTALSCTPSYVELLLDRLTDQQLETWSAQLRLVLVGGEPGGSAPALRERVRQSLGADIVNANYGLAEVLSNFGSECREHDGLHFHGQDALWVELVDSGSGASVPLDAGAQGELVLTHTRREAQPLVRYRTNDLVQIVSTDPCPCGRASFRFRLRGRADDMFVVRGINVFPGAIQEALGALGPEAGDFAVVLPPTDTFDVVPLWLEGPEGEPGARLAERAEAVIKQQIGCGAQVRVVPRGRLPRTEGKTQRVYRDGDAPA